MRNLARGFAGFVLLLLVGACTDRQPTEPIPADALLLATTGDEGLVLWDGTVGEESHGSHEVITTVSDGMVCRMTTFENGGQFQEIHPEANYLIDGSGMRFPDWRTLTSGYYVNNPSPPTIALMTAASHEVTFDDPVSVVSFYYASSVDVTLNAFDAAGTLLATVTGPSNGQSTGFSLWELLGVAVAGDIITRVTVDGGQYVTGIDDITNCRGSLTPEQQIQAILDELLADEDLNGNVAGSLASKLQNVIAKFDKDNVGAAINQLQAFINQIEALIQAGTLAQPDGELLIDVAQSVIDQLSA